MKKILLLCLLISTSLNSMQLLKKLKEKGIATYEGISYLHEQYPCLTQALAVMSAADIAINTFIFYDRSIFVSLAFDGLSVGGMAYAFGQFGKWQQAVDQDCLNRTLTIAALTGSTQSIDPYLEAGAEINGEVSYDTILQKSFFCPLYATLSTSKLSLDRKLEMARLLKERGADVNWKTKHLKSTILMLLATKITQRDLSKEIEWLLDNGANRNARNAMNDTAIDLAKRCEYFDRAQLIEHYQPKAQ